MWKSQAAAKIAKVDFEVVTERVIAEYGIFQLQKVIDFRDILLSFAEKQVTHTTPCTVHTGHAHTSRTLTTPRTVHLAPCTHPIYRSHRVLQYVSIIPCRLRLNTCKPKLLSMLFHLSASSSHCVYSSTNTSFLSPPPSFYFPLSPSTASLPTFPPPPHLTSHPLLYLTSSPYLPTSPHILSLPSFT